jgi:hypothetical protein
MFPFTSVEHIAKEESDHMPLLIKVRDAQTAMISSIFRGFKFEEMWLKHENYEEMVKNAWENRRGGEFQKRRRRGGNMGLDTLWRQLREIYTQMKRCGFEIFDSVREEIKRLWSQLDKAQTAAQLHGSSLEVRELEKKMPDIF